MKIKIKLYVGICILIYCISCTQNPDINFNKERWIKDFNGCLGYRKDIYEEILNQKEKLLGVSSKKIIKTIGKPHINELYQRNQKFFVYQISNARSCETPVDSTELYLIIRFNALELATEIYINDNSSPTD